MSVIVRVSPILLAAISLVAMVASPARAEDKWSDTKAFVRSDATSLKILEPEGYRVSVVVDKKVVSDTLPAIVRLPDEGFYQVTITAPSGAAWSQKVEARRYQITELRVKHTVSEAPATPAAAPQRKYIGTMVNRVSTCGKKLAAKVELVDGAGVTAAFQIKTNSLEQGSVVGGTYDVRAYVWDAGANDWTYQTTTSALFNRDNWKITLLCGTGKLEIKLGD